MWWGRVIVEQPSLLVIHQRTHRAVLLFFALLAATKLLRRLLLLCWLLLLCCWLLLLLLLFRLLLLRTAAAVFCKGRGGRLCAVSINRGAFAGRPAHWTGFACVYVLIGVVVSFRAEGETRRVSHARLPNCGASTRARPPHLAPLLEAWPS